MIRKLRQKFVLINMLFVLMILTTMLGVIFISYCRSSVRDSTLFMESAIQKALRTEQRELFRQEPQPKSTRERGTQNNPTGTQNNPAGTQNNPAGVQNNPTGTQNNPAGAQKAPAGKQNGWRNEERIPGPRLPYTVLFVGSSGIPTIVESQDMDMDDALAAELLEAAKADHASRGIVQNFFSWLVKAEVVQGDGWVRKSGYLGNYGLRYLCYTSRDGNSRVIFTDISYIRESAFRNLITFFGIYLVAALLFFFLSFWLSSWALAPVEKAWEQQNRFVADASHELKTPITVILANLGILSAHPDDTVRKQLRWISNTKEEAERMRLLVEDLLFLAKSDAGALAPAFQEVDFSNCVEDRALNFESVAFEREVALESQVAPGLKVNGSEGQLKQLLTILLDNAVKYAGNKGHVNLTAQKKQDKVVLQIQNTGDPIAKEDLPHIFERFYRTDKSRVRKEGGYGLGLAIAENIVKHHKGSIRCESSAETGTIFTVELAAV